MIVRVKGVKKVKAKSGAIYYYHRATGVRLTTKPGTTAFAAEVDRLNRGRTTMPRAQAGTWGGLVAKYRVSPEFAKLADRTKADYQKVFDWLADIDGILIFQIDGPTVLAIRDRAFEKKKRRFANHVTQVISAVMNWGTPRKLSHAYPLAAQRGIKIERPKTLPRANRPWTEAEASEVFRAARGGLLAALALAYYAGMRGGDIVRVTWSIYDGDRLEWQQGKTGDPVWLPALPELRAALDSTNRVSPNIVTSVYGRPLSEAGLRKAFRTLVLRLMKEGRIAPGLTLHGCRHTLGDELANAGAEPQMIQAVLGHRSMVASLHYSKGADRKRAAAAAVHLLETERERRAGQSGKNGKTAKLGK